MSKEFIFTVEVEEKNVLWKCVVHEDVCVTYEGDVECERLPITNPQKKKGVLMIDSSAKVYDEVLPFQLENGVPYIKLEGEWIMSDTTMEDRLQARIKQVKKEAYLMFGMGIVCFLILLGQFLIMGTVGEWPIAPVLGVFCFACCGYQLIRLKQEMEARGLTFSLKL